METIVNVSWVLREHHAVCRLPPTLLLSQRKASVYPNYFISWKQKQLHHELLLNAKLPYDRIRGILDVIGGLAVWRHNTKKKKSGMIVIL